MIHIFAITVLAAIFLGQFFYRSRIKDAARGFFFLAIAMIFGAALHAAFSQYQNWQEGAFTRFLLPPHQRISYFLVDVGKKIFSPPLISLLAAIVIPRIAWLLNKKYEERFFYDHEFDLMRLGIFLTGYPGFLFYIVLVLAAGLFLSYLFLLLGRGRAPFKWFWMPAGILTTVLINWVLPEIVIKSFAI